MNSNSYKQKKCAENIVHDNLPLEIIRYIDTQITDVLSLVKNNNNNVATGSIIPPLTVQHWIPHRQN